MGGVQTAEERIAEIRHRHHDFDKAKPGSLLQLEQANILCIEDVPWLLDRVVELTKVLERTQPRIAW